MLWKHANGMKGWLMVLTVFSLPPSALAAVYINEVMYDPYGSDTGREWIELYSNGSCENVSQWRLLEAGTNHLLTLVQGNSTLCTNQYAVIADNPANFLAEYAFFNGTLFDSTFSLLNSNESLALKNSSLVVVDNLTYFSSWGASDNGMSLEFMSGSWIESIAYGGTPGLPNGLNISLVNLSTSSGAGLNLTVVMSSPLYIGFTYDSLFKITNLAYPAITGINATIYYNITNSTTVIKQDAFNLTGINSYKTANTGEYTPNETGNFTICGRIINSTMQDNVTVDDSDCKLVEVLDPSTIPCNVSITVYSNQTIYNLGNTIKFYNLLNNDSYPYIIEYWAEDLFGTIVKNKINTTNQNQKTWTPNFDEEDRAYLIKTRIAWLACNDSNTTDNSDELLVALRGQIIQPVTVSSIAIEEVDNQTQFGDVSYAKVRIYKGDTSAYAITAEISQGSSSVSEETKFYAYTKYTNYSVKLPILTDDNCDGKLPDGSYTITVSGLGKSDSSQIRLYGSADYCGASSSSSSTSGSSNSSKSKFTYKLTSYPEKITSGKEFTSKVEIESDDKDHELEIYSYVYRGSKSYSGERDANRQKVLLDADSSVVVELKNTAYVSEEGNYSFKVKIRKDDLKTEKEITVPLYVDVDEKLVKEAKQEVELKAAKEKEAKDEKPADWYFNRVDEPVTVFLSPSYKAKRATIYSLLGLFVLLNIAIIVIKKNII